MSTSSYASVPTFCRAHASSLSASARCASSKNGQARNVLSAMAPTRTPHPNLPPQGGKAKRSALNFSLPLEGGGLGGGCQPARRFRHRSIPPELPLLLGREGAVSALEILGPPPG